MEIECKHSCGVYAIRNKVTNKYYIGSTTRLKVRIREHYNRLKNQTHHSIKLQSSVNKHGIDVFEAILLAEFENEIDILELRKLEHDMIVKYDACKNGYVISENTSWTANFNSTQRKEVGKKISNSLKGRKHTEEHKRKVGQIKSAQNTGSGNPNTKLSEEDVRQIRYMWSTGNYTYKDIQAIYPVGKRGVYGILSKTTWKHVI